MSASELEERLDQLTTNLVFPLQLEKYVDTPALDALCALVVEQREVGLFSGVIEARLVGKFWWIFTAMLAEADHAHDPEPILDAAWRYQEELQRAFGPFR